MARPLAFRSHGLAQIVTHPHPAGQGLAGQKIDHIQHMVEDAALVVGLGTGRDMAGVCPPRFVKELITTIRKAYPDLVLDYHRHYTDGLFVPAVGAAAEAGCHIVDVALGASVRWYGQGEVLSTAAYIEEDLGVPVSLTAGDKEMIRTTNFVLKQIMAFHGKAILYRTTDFKSNEYRNLLGGNLFETLEDNPMTARRAASRR